MKNSLINRKTTSILLLFYLICLLLNPSTSYGNQCNNEKDCNFSTYGKDAVTDQKNAFIKYTVYKEFEPRISFTNISNEKEKLKDYRDKYTLIYFFATWCNTCVTELKQLDNILEEAKFIDFKNLQIIALSSDYKSKESVQKILDTNGIKNIKLRFDDKKINTNKLKVSTLPTAILVDNSGKISLRKEGNMNWAKHQRDLLEFINVDSENFTNDIKNTYENDKVGDIILNKSYNDITLIN